MDKIIYFTRHAEGLHNATDNWSLVDPKLTKRGIAQCKELNLQTKDTFQKTAEALIVSPLKRTLSTALISYPGLIERLGIGNVILEPMLQEQNSLPCDHGSPTREIEVMSEYTGLDFSTLPDKWWVKKGVYSSSSKAIDARCRHVRRMLRDRPEKRIVVVAHKDLLETLTETGYSYYSEWCNAEVRQYTFKSDTDDAAKVVLMKKGAKIGEAEPSGKDLQESLEDGNDDISDEYSDD